jgi:ketosteroid isomerase-like protein
MTTHATGNTARTVVPREDPGDLRSVLEDWYEALIAKDGAALAAMMDDDIQVGIIGSTPLSGHHVGKAAVLENARQLHENLADDFRHGVYWRIVCQESNCAVVLARAEGMATHDRYDQTYCMVFWIRHRRVVKILEFIDTVVVEAALFGNHLEHRQPPPTVPMDITDASDPVQEVPM